MVQGSSESEVVIVDQESVLSCACSERTNTMRGVFERRIRINVVRVFQRLLKNLKMDIPSTSWPKLTAIFFSRSVSSFDRFVIVNMHPPSYALLMISRVYSHQSVC